MTSAEQRIATLNRMLAQHGETITIRARTGTGNARQVTSTVTCKAIVRPAGRLDTAALQLVGTVSQNDFIVVTSPNGMEGFISGRPSAEDAVIPMKGNSVTVSGQEFSVEAGAAVRIADKIVRIEIHLRG